MSIRAPNISVVDEFRRQNVIDHPSKGTSAPETTCYEHYERSIITCTRGETICYCVCVFVSKTRRMAIANGTCVSFCNQPKAWVHPWDNRGKCYTDGKRTQCWSNASQHIDHASVFNRLRAIERYLSEIATFSYPLHLTPVVFPLEFREKVWSSEN